MALFKSSKPSEPAPEPAAQPAAGVPQKKSVPTPSRREAEAARRERLNPTLSPKEAKRRQREAESAHRKRSWDAVEESQPRQLMRDLVDSRFSLGEFAMPVLLAIMALTLIPGFAPYVQWLLYASWLFILALVVDSYLTWRRYKVLAAQRVPTAPLKGMFMYGFNRQMSFRRWRQPAPRIKRGDAF